MKASFLVCDATTFVEALLDRQGAAAVLLRRLAAAGELRLVWSNSIEQDVRRALAYAPFAQRVPFSQAELDRYLAAWAVMAVDVVDDGAPVADFGGRSGDRKYYRSAQIVGSALVVSTDPELLRWRGAGGVDALTPTACLELLQAQKQVALMPQRS